MRAFAASLVLRMHADRARHAADQKVGVRVLAAEDGVQLRHLALPCQRVQIMRHRHQVGLRRQLVGGMSPVSVGEDAQLSAFDEGLDALLHVREIARRGSRVGRAHGLRQRRGGLGIGLQRRDHVHPVQRVQVVEVHHMVVHELRRDHQVADQLRVGRHFVFQRVLHRAHRGDAMHQRAHAADALRERPCVARVAAAQDNLDAAHHRAGTGSARDAVVRIGLRLDAQVALDAGDRIDYDGLRHVDVPFSLEIHQPRIDTDKTVRIKPK